MASIEERLRRQLDVARTAQERSEVATKRLKDQANALEARIKGVSIPEVEADQPARGKPLGRQSKTELLELAKELRVDVPEDATVEQLRDALSREDSQLRRPSLHLSQSQNPSQRALYRHE